MNFIFFLVLTSLSLNVMADSKKDYPAKYVPSPFEVVPLNSPVKGEVASFLLKVPAEFSIDKVQYGLKNANHYKVKEKNFKDINLADDPQGKVLHVATGKLPPGFYQLYVKVKDKQKNDHDFKSKYHDHVRFVIDETLEVVMPDEKQNNKTIKGIDSDNDGIRDDVQRLINSKYGTDQNFKLALRQWAIAFQQVLTTIDKKEENIEATYRSFDAKSCIISIKEIKEALKTKNTIKAEYLNTLKRLTANKKSSFNFHGKGGTLPDNEEALCQFEIEQGGGQIE